MALLTYRVKPAKLAIVRATGINHVSISATDLETSTRFYEEVFGMERIPTPIFETPVQWLRVGDLQLHLFFGLAAATQHVIRAASGDDSSTNDDGIEAAKGKHRRF